MAVGEQELSSTERKGSIVEFDTLTQLGKTAMTLEAELYGIRKILATSGEYKVPEEYGILVEPDHSALHGLILERLIEENGDYTQHGVFSGELENKEDTGLRRDTVEGNQAFVGKSMSYDRDARQLYVYGPDKQFRVAFNSSTALSLQIQDTIDAHWPVKE